MIAPLRGFGSTGSCFWEWRGAGAAVVPLGSAHAPEARPTPSVAVSAATAAHGELR